MLLTIKRTNPDYRPLELIINGKVLLPYNKDYYVSEFGDVFSYRNRKFLKHNYDCDGYPRVDIYGKHVKVHRMVYETWIGVVPEGKQINHYDDDKRNIDVLNLYAGTQSQNRHDCVRNGHAVGNSYHLIIKDKYTGEVLTFYPAKEFIKYSGHSLGNGSIKRILDKDWFNNQYELIEYDIGKV